MHTQDMADANIEKIGQLFPNCLTERLNENGEPEMAIDFDKLKQELSKDIVEGNQERYQFTWPGKKNAIRISSTPTNTTLRPQRESSVNFDDTKNIYIEGDNLEVIKLLRENYLGQIKMIYIDPPYNTGNDFVYADNFSQSSSDFKSKSGLFDGNGNMLLGNYEVNSEGNGRFHTDWLNMIYPRLKVSKDLLTQDGVIFVSIDDSEYENLKKVCDEIFGAVNYIATIVRNTNSSKNQSLFVSVSHEYCIIYAKNIEALKSKHNDNKWCVPKNNVEEYVAKVKQLQKEGLTAEEITEELKCLTKYPRFIDFTNYWYFDEHGLYSKGDLGGVPNGNKTPVMNPITGELDPIPPGGFRFNVDKMEQLAKEGRIHFHTDGSLPRIKRYLDENLTQRPKSIMSDDQRPDSNIMQEFNTPFDNPKQLSFMKRIISIMDNDCLVLDFFSGSATTAHAVMELNAEDHGSRSFIMVQIPETTDEKSAAYKAGYTNLCQIGEERIRKAGEKIQSTISDGESDIFKQSDKSEVDTGFRVLKLDTSNMQDVYYKPEEFSEMSLFEDNVKPDRTPEDLLFQVMLECNLPLSAKIERKTIAGKEVFNVNEGYLLACFDEDVNETVITEVAKLKPYYFIMRDKSLSSDNVADNFEQIFNAYSKDTIRKIL